jgi:1-phosphofructokinase
MIITVTLNSAIDKRGEVEILEQGRVNRVTNIVRTVGGKGINVSKKVKILGGETIATGFTGGSGGVIINRFFEQSGIQNDMVTVSGMTRTNLKIVEKNGLVTEFNNPGPTIKEEEMAQLIEKIEKYAESDHIFVFGGSQPENYGPEIYTELIQKVKEKGRYVIFEGNRRTLEAGAAAKPNVLITSRIALEQINKMDYHADEKDVVKMCQKYLKQGVEQVVVPMGTAGILFVKADELIFCPRIRMDVYSEAGAYDSIAAAFAYGKQNNWLYMDVLCNAVALSAVSSVKSVEEITLEDVESLVSKVDIQRRTKYA